MCPPWCPTCCSRVSSPSANKCVTQGSANRVHQLRCTELSWQLDGKPSSLPLFCRCSGLQCVLPVTRCTGNSVSCCSIQMAPPSWPTSATPRAPPSCLLHWPRSPRCVTSSAWRSCWRLQCTCGEYTRLRCRSWPQWTLTGWVVPGAKGGQGGVTGDCTGAGLLTHSLNQSRNMQHHALIDCPE